MTSASAEPTQIGAGATLNLDESFKVGPLNRRIFGSFVEHLGRCVYTGIYEPEHESADQFGFRGDVADLVRELGVTIVRYPGGNFVSGYNWEDGVGPKGDRPTKFDLAWRTIETNQVGTDEFLAWCERLGVEPMLAVNLGTRGLNEAMELLQYANGEPGTAITDSRVQNGRLDPYGVRVWCLGNEMDGPWQMGHKTPEEYARVAAETARAMKRFDESLDLVACGSSGRKMATFGTWERIVLAECFDLVEHISAHAYYEPVDGDEDSFLASAEDMDRFICAVVATADHVAAVRGSDKRIMVSFDEWNVWFQQRFHGEQDLEIRETPALIEDVYDVQDAVVVGSLLIELMRHTDRVSMACQAQLVNVIAPIRTTPAGAVWRQTIFHPFAISAKHAHGTVLRTGAVGPTMNTSAYGDVDQLLSTATYDEEAGEVTVFAVNRSRVAELPLSIVLNGFGGNLHLVEHSCLYDEDPHAINSETEPERVLPRSGSSTLDGGRLSTVLPPTSWHCIRLGTRNSQTG